MASNLTLRIAFAAVAIPLAVGIVWLGGWPFAIALAALGVLGAREIYDLARRQGFDALDRTGGIAAAAIPLLAYWAKAPAAAYFGAVWLMSALVVAMFRRGPTGKPLAVVSVTLFGCLYASALLAFLIPIRHGGEAAPPALPHLSLPLFSLVLTLIGETPAVSPGG